MKRPESPCKNCSEKPCQSLYNEDQECWQGHSHFDDLVKAHLEQKKKKTEKTRQSDLR